MNKLKNLPSSVWLSALTTLAFLFCWPDTSIKSMLPLDPFDLDTSIDFRHTRKEKQLEANRTVILWQDLYKNCIFINYILFCFLLFCSPFITLFFNSPLITFSFIKEKKDTRVYFHYKPVKLITENCYRKFINTFWPVRSEFKTEF